MLAVLIFLAAITAANLSAAYFGPAATVVNSFILIGFDLSLRDRIHEAWHGHGLALKMFLLVVAGAAITYIINSNAGMIGVASVVAFAAALIVDAILYQMFFQKKRILKMNYSNLGSSAVDSILFPTIAFGVLMPWIVLGQFAAKVGGGFLWSLVLRGRQ
ncbi:MAG: VUT family protein [Desulfobacteraceae bacterium]|nr:MAG: VUT family protein [Desulfobacteraceae bacterium]